jgi:hypothetical protein
VDRRADDGLGVPFAAERGRLKAGRPSAVSSLFFNPFFPFFFNGTLTRRL